MYYQKSKYGAKKVVTEDGTFDSKKEYRRYIDLEILQKQGVISNLQRQVSYELLPSQKIDGKVAERPVKYIADFVYERDGVVVVEDTKGVKTPEYIIKRKLMLYRHGIRIQEV